jgi:hypothetical protein
MDRLAAEDRCLKPGDEIVAIDCRELNPELSRDDIKVLILSQTPRQFTVHRDSRAALRR